MKCFVCDYQQEIGSFCLICGNKFEEPILNTEGVISIEKTNRRTSSPTTNVHIENTKKKIKEYKSYFIQQLKKPSLTYTRGDAELTRSLISIILFTALLTTSFFLYNSYLYKGNSPKFIPFFIELFLLVILMMSIVILSLYLINSFFGTQHTVRTLISFYGGQLSPLIISAAFSLLLMLTNSYNYGNILLTISLLLAIFIQPLYIISFTLTKNRTTVDPLYGFLLYLILFTILFVLLLTVVGNSTGAGYFNNLNYLF